MHEPEFFQKLIEDSLQKIEFGNQPVELYDPIRYMLSLGGKRMRPAMLLMSAELFQGDFQTMLSPALGIEVFHNFTLLHDDIMDKAPLRRGKATVHEKWNKDVAILSGDVMFVKASQLVAEAHEKYLRQVLKLFFDSATAVCEGQQEDMNFESNSSIGIPDYINMIKSKTAALLACALKMGAILSGALQKDADLIYNFGINIGIAFQLHDDILDVYGDEQKFGKQRGGDIIANKKTFLLLKAMELSGNDDSKELSKWIAEKDFDAKEKINAVKEVYSSLNIKDLAEKEMEKFFSKALASLEAINVSGERKIILRKFSEKLMVREV
jgi:geranylgeranyl diphosphate synthase type II